MCGLLQELRRLGRVLRDGRARLMHEGVLSRWGPTCELSKRGDLLVCPGWRGWWEKRLPGGCGRWKSRSQAGQRLGAWMHSVTVITKGVRKPGVRLEDPGRWQQGGWKGTERLDGGITGVQAGDDKPLRRQEGREERKSQAWERERGGPVSPAP